MKSDDIPNFANKIHKESGRLLSLISDIMELSQLDEKFSDEEFAPVDLAGVASEVAEDLRSNAEKHGITITVDTKTAVINGNRNQIYELIYNLCDNAIRYNRENGSVKCQQREWHPRKAHACGAFPGIPIPVSATLTNGCSLSSPVMIFTEPFSRL